MPFVRGLHQRTARDRTTLPQGSRPQTAQWTEQMMQQKAPTTTVGAFRLSIIRLD